MSNAEKKYVKLRTSGKTFDEIWSTLKQSNLKIQEMFEGADSEQEVRLAAMDAISNHMPSFVVGDKIKNYPWTLTIKRDSFLFRTGFGLTISYKIDFEFDENRHVTGTTYHFSVTVPAKEVYPQKLLANAGWVVDDEEE